MLERCKGSLDHLLLCEGIAGPKGAMMGGAEQRAFIIAGKLC